MEQPLLAQRPAAVVPRRLATLAPTASTKCQLDPPVSKSRQAHTFATHHAKQAAACQAAPRLVARRLPIVPLIVLLATSLIMLSTTRPGALAGEPPLPPLLAAAA